MRKFVQIFLCSICLLSLSCQNHTTELTELQKQQITDSAKAVVKKVFEYSNNMDFETGLNHYSETSNSYFITDGTMHSLTDLKRAYKDIGPAVEDLHTIQLKAGMFRF